MTFYLTLLAPLIFTLSLIALSGLPGFADLVLPHEARSPSCLSMIPFIVSRFCWVLALGGVLFAGFIFIDRKNWQFSNKSGAAVSILILLCVGFYWLVVTRCLQFPISLDDTYIDYTYARNWANFARFDYNPGEHVSGYTSVFHVFVLVVFSLISGSRDIVMVSENLNLAIQMITYLLLFAFLRKAYQSAWLGLLAAALFATNSYYCLQAIEGKESSIVALLILLAFFAIQEGRWRLFAWLSALIPLTRPEGLLWLGLAVLWTWKRRVDWKLWMQPLLLLSAYYIFTLIYFGSIIPHGAFGRMAMMQTRRHLIDYQFGQSLCSLCKDTIDWLLTRFFSGVSLLNSYIQSGLGSGSAPMDLTTLPGMLQGFLVLALMAVFARTRPWLRFYFLAASAILMFDAFSEAPTWSWYHSWFGLISILTLPLVIDWLARYVLSAKIVAVARVMSAVAILALVQNHLVDGAAPFGCLDELSKRYFAYRDAAEFFNALSPSPHMVATYEPGIFGYHYVKGRILDLSALVSDEPRSYYPPPANDRSDIGIWGGFPSKVVTDLKPDWVMFLDTHSRNGLLRNDEFFKHYTLSRFYPNTALSGQGLMVYRLVK